MDGREGGSLRAAPSGRALSDVEVEEFNEHEEDGTGGD